MLRGIVFDFDGTILDTESACYRAWNEVFQRCGVELPLHLWATAVGTSADAFDPMAYLKAQVKAELDAEALDSERRRRERALMRQTPLRPGIVDLLREAKERGLKTGIATNSYRTWVDDLLHPFGLLDAFDAIVTADDADRLKPAPDLYVKALERLELDPKQTVAIEDSPSGAAAAMAAGVWCVVVTNEITRSFSFPQVHLRLETLAGVNLDQLRRLVQTEAQKSAP